jgi:hypothetical protein
MFAIFIKNERPDKIFPDFAHIIYGQVGRDVILAHDPIDNAFVDDGFVNVNVVGILDSVLESKVFGE